MGIYNNRLFSSPAEEGELAAKSDNQKAAAKASRKLKRQIKIQESYDREQARMKRASTWFFSQIEKQNGDV